MTVHSSSPRRIPIILGKRPVLFSALLLAGTSSIATRAAPVAQPAAASAHVAHGKARHTPVVRAPTLETITVTSARTARFHSMATTVNTISGREIQALHIVSPKELAAFIPGVTAVNATSGSTPIFSIRGIGLDDYVGTNMGGIGIYIDGVFAPYPVLYSGQMLDVQTVSAEKGPQGFEYGRSTTGGSMNVESIKPTDHFGGYLNWGYSSYGTNTARGAINTPITDKIFNRLAFSYINGDGWQKDIHTGRHYGAQDILSLRNLTQFVIDDQSSLMVNIHYTRDKGAPVSPQDVDGDAMNGLPDRTIGVGQNAKYNAVNVGDNRVSRKENGGGIGINYTRSFDFGTFTSATGIDFYRRDDYDNYDGESVRVGDYRWNDTTIAQSHDMHLNMTLAKRLNLTVGVYESFDKINGAYISYREFALGSPNASLTDHFVQKNLSSGLYVSTVTHIIKGLDFIAAGRLSYDERGFDGGTLDNVGAVTGEAGSHLSYVNQQHKYERLTGRVGLRYTIVPGTMVYGTISNGYKAGAYFAAPVTAPQALDYVHPENLIAYEIGAKTSLLKNKVQIEGSLFDYEYHNRQTLFVAEMPRDITSLSLGLIPRAQTRGGELSSTLHDVVPNLDLRGAFAYLDAQTISSVSSIGGLPLLGDVASHSALPFAPRFSWNAVARYGIDVSLGYRATLQASYTWKDNMLVALGDPNGKTSKISSMGLRMEVGPKTGKWNAAVYVDNMLNKHGNTYSFTASDNSRTQYIQTPRWVGCDLRYNF